VRTELDHLLAHLLEGVAAQAEVVLSALAEAADIVDRGSREGEEPLVGVEEQIVERYRALEHEVEVLLARQAPVASDLRHVLALLRVNHHLERIGHHAVRIARSTHDPTAAPDPSMTAALLGAMADRALDIASRAVHALRACDHEAAESLRELDVEIDTLEGAVAEAAMEEFHGTEGGRERVLWALAVARRLERIGDHAVGISLRTREMRHRNGEPV
jgi:phosphate transport system protein